MIGLARLDHLHDPDRAVWVADSFEGLPRPDPARYPADAGDRHWTWRELAVSVDAARRNFEKHGMLDDRVRFLQGWFGDTLPAAPIERLALLRVDADMYQSTWEAASALYPKVVRGGYVIVDDYGAIENRRRAVDDVRLAAGISAPLEWADWPAVFWRRASPGGG